MVSRMLKLLSRRLLAFTHLENVTSRTLTHPRSFSCIDFPENSHWNRKQSLDLTFKRRYNTDEPFTVTPLSSETTEGKIYVRSEYWKRQSLEDFINFLETLGQSQLCSASLSIIFDILENKIEDNKRQSDGVFHKQVINAVGVQRLLRSTKFLAPTLEPLVLCKAATVFSKLQLSPKHPAFELMLSHILQNLQSLDLMSILLLTNMSEQHAKDTESVYIFALKCILPVAVENHFLQVNDEWSIEQLAKLFRAATRVGCNSKNYVKIIDLLVTKSPTSLSSVKLAQLLNGLADSPAELLYRPDIVDFVRQCFNILNDKLEELNHTLLFRLLRKSAKANIDRIDTVNCLYNEEFCERSIPVILRSNNKTNILEACRYFGDLRYISVEFLETCAEIVAADPSLILRNYNLFFTFLRILAEFSYKPETWEVLQKIFLNHPALAQVNDSSTVSLDAAVALHFLILEISPHNIVEKLFSHKCDWAIAMNTPFALNLICTAITRLHPDYAGPFPPVHIIENWQNERGESLLATERKANPFWLSIENCVSAALGGDEYFTRGVHPDGIFVDYCIVMHADGYPVIQSNRNPSILADIERPANCEVVFVKILPAKDCTRNTERPRGIRVLEERILGMFGRCAFMYIPTLNTLDKDEKIAYMRNKLGMRPI